MGLSREFFARELVVAEMKIEGAIEPKNEVRKAPQESVAVQRSYKVLRRPQQDAGH